MAIVRPFKAIRPTKGLEDKVISLPYDVMNRAEAKEMAKDNKYSFLHITRSEIDFDDEVNPYEKEIYLHSKAVIEENLEDGVFFEESKPMIYIYRQKMGDHVQTGIVGCVSVDDYENNVIKKHEFTRKEKEVDRVNHFNICNANTEPVFLTYRDNDKIRNLVESYTANHPMEYDVTTDDGITHQLWAVSDDNVTYGICGVFKTIDSLYIADGHHRTQSAYRVSKKRREKNPGYTGEEEFNYFMAAIFPDNDLRIYDYNRVVKDLNGLSKEEFIDAVLKAGFDVENVGKEPYRPAKKTEFGMFLDGDWYRLTANENLYVGDIADKLDVAVLQKNVLSPILGIEDPRTDKRIDFIGGIRGLKEIERRVEIDMEVGFAVYPVEISDIIGISDMGGVMPPKSTWFEPKLASGLFVHKL